MDVKWDWQESKSIIEVKCHKIHKISLMQSVEQWLITLNKKNNIRV